MFSRGRYFRIQRPNALIWALATHFLFDHVRSGQATWFVCHIATSQIWLELLLCHWSQNRIIFMISCMFQIPSGELIRHFQILIEALRSSPQAFPMPNLKQPCSEALSTNKTTFSERPLCSYSLRVRFLLDSPLRERAAGFYEEGAVRMRQPCRRYPSCSGPQVSPASGEGSLLLSWSSWAGKVPFLLTL